MMLYNSDIVVNDSFNDARDARSNENTRQSIVKEAKMWLADYAQAREEAKPRLALKITRSK